MHSEIKLFLLKIVKYNGNPTPLIKMGYEYSQILQLIDELIQEGLVEKNRNKFLVTEAGLNEVRKLNEGLKRKNSSIWIEPDTASKISQIDLNDVFLPDQNDLSF